MSMRRRLFVSFGIGLVLMLGVSALRSIARAQVPAAPEPAATAGPAAAATGRLPSTFRAIRRETPFLTSGASLIAASSRGSPS